MNHYGKILIKKYYKINEESTTKKMLFQKQKIQIEKIINKTKILTITKRARKVFLKKN
jgi:hypothetical protein